MLLIEHRSPHLYREDAYREYCWSVDVYEAYQPSSFIYLCFEAFRDSCMEYGLQLAQPTNGQPSKNQFPWRGERQAADDGAKFFGLITRVEDLSNVDAVHAALSAGRNVIALLPSGALSCWWYGNKDRLDRAIEAASRLGIANAENKVRAEFPHRGTVWWEELSTNNSGRLFITEDHYISDCYFMDGYGRSDQNHQELTSLVRSFAVFKWPLLRVSIRNGVSTWPCHEPLSLIIDIHSHGPHLDAAQISFIFPESFEPVGPVDRDIPRLSTLGKTSVAIQLIPGVDGRFENLLSVEAISPSFGSLVTQSPLQDIEILPSYGNMLRASASRDDHGLTALLGVYERLHDFPEVRILPGLVDIDPRACLNKMRIVAEKLLRAALSKAGASTPNTTFAANIHAAQSAKQ